MKMKMASIYFFHRIFLSQTFRGNQDAVNPVTHLLAEPIIAQALRVKPLTSSSSGPCLRLEVFGCENGEFAHLKIVMACCGL